MKSEKKKSHIYVDTKTSIKELITRAKQSSRIALDIEADSLHHYFEKVCLIQLKVGSASYIVDPLAGIDLTGLLKVLADKPLILHGGDYDLRMLREQYAFKPNSEVFDTMLAAQLLGYERYGLVAVVQKLFGITLSKAGQKSNWSKRPLTQAQLRYAGEDTNYLESLADKLKSELKRLGREDWHRQCCEFMVRSTDSGKTTKNNKDKWRIRGSSKLIPRQLTFVKEIWNWREKQAQIADRPPFKVMLNSLIMQLALWADSNPNTPLENGPKLPRNCRNKRLAMLKNAIRKAANMDETESPGQRQSVPYKPLDPKTMEMIEALRRECSSIADRLKIDPSLLAPRASLTTIVYKKLRSLNEIIKSGSLMPWQAELIEPVVNKILKKNY